MTATTPIGARQRVFDPATEIVAGSFSWTTDMDDLIDFLTCVTVGVALGLGPVLIWFWIWGPA